MEKVASRIVRIAVSSIGCYLSTLLILPFLDDVGIGIGHLELSWTVAIACLLMLAPSSVTQAGSAKETQPTKSTPQPQGVCRLSTEAAHAVLNCFGQWRSAGQRK